MLILISIDVDVGSSYFYSLVASVYRSSSLLSVLIVYLNYESLYGSFLLLAQQLAVDA